MKKQIMNTIASFVIRRSMTSLSLPSTRGYCQPDIRRLKSENSLGLKSHKKHYKTIVFLLSLCAIIVSANPIIVFAETEDDDSQTIYDIYDSDDIQRWENDALNHAYNDPVVGDWKQQNPLTVSKKVITNPDSMNTSYTIEGSWSWRDGVICISSVSTNSNWTHGHAGIIAPSPYFYATCEANPNEGSTVHGVEIRYGEWYSADDGYDIWQVGVISTSEAQDATAAQWAVGKLNLPYGNPFITPLSARNKFYCSHLVYAAYLDTCGVNLDTSSYPLMIHPYELFQNSQTAIIFRKYYANNSY